MSQNAVGLRCKLVSVSDERCFNELSMQRQIPPVPASAGAAVAQGAAGGTGAQPRARTISSPMALPPGAGGRVSPALAGLNVQVGDARPSPAGPLFGPPSPLSRCTACGTVLPPVVPQLLPAHPPSAHSPHPSPSSSWAAATVRLHFQTLLYANKRWNYRSKCVTLHNKPGRAYFRWCATVQNEGKSFGQLILVQKKLTLLCR